MPMFLYVRGEDAPCQALLSALDAGSFEPHNGSFDLLHILNRLRRVFMEQNDEHALVESSLIWSGLYPRAAPADRAHLRLLLEYLNLNIEDLHSHLLIETLPKSWEYGPDIALYTLFGKNAPAAIQRLHLKTSDIGEALEMAMVPALAAPNNASSLFSLVQEVLDEKMHATWNTFCSVMDLLDEPSNVFEKLWPINGTHHLFDLNKKATHYANQWHSQLGNSVSIELPTESWAPTY